MIGDPLQRAFGVLHAVKTVGIVIGDQQLQGNLSDFADFRAFRPDLHALLDRRFAGNGGSLPVDLHHTESACARRL